SMISHGSGYTSPPIVYLKGGGGNGAYGVANLSGDTVGSITITNPGRGYTSPPTVVISGVKPAAISAVNANPTITKNGSPITLPLCVTAITLGNVGSSYATAPTVTITPAAG